MQQRTNFCIVYGGNVLKIVFYFFPILSFQKNNVVQLCHPFQKLGFSLPNSDTSQRVQQLYCDIWFWDFFNLYLPPPFYAVLLYSCYRVKLTFGGTPSSPPAAFLKKNWLKQLQKNGGTVPKVKSKSKLLQVLEPKISLIDLNVLY